MGRKKSDKPKIDIRLRVGPDLHDRIAKAADRAGDSVAGYIRSAVVKELRKSEREGS